jgi:hypothetical protein
MTVPSLDHTDLSFGFSDPALITQVLYYDAGRGAGDALRFVTVGPEADTGGRQYCGAIDTGHTGSSAAGNVRVSEDKLALPVDGEFGFWESGPVIANQDNGCGAPNGSDEIYAFQPGGLPRLGSFDAASVACQDHFDVGAFLDRASKLVVKQTTVRGINQPVYTVAFVTADDRVIPDDYDSINLYLAGSDGSAHITDCGGSPIVNPIATEQGQSAFCVKGGMNGSDRVTVRADYSLSTLSPVSLTVPEHLAVGAGLHHHQDRRPHPDGHARPCHPDDWCGPPRDAEASPEHGRETAAGRAPHPEGDRVGEDYDRGPHHGRVSERHLQDEGLTAAVTPRIVSTTSSGSSYIGT